MTTEASNTTPAMGATIVLPTARRTGPLATPVPQTAARAPEKPSAARALERRGPVRRWVLLATPRRSAAGGPRHRLTSHPQSPISAVQSTAKPCQLMAQPRHHIIHRPGCRLQCASHTNETMNERVEL